MLEPHPPLLQKETGEQKAKGKIKIKISNKEVESIEGNISHDTWSIFLFVLFINHLHASTVTTQSIAQSFESI